jgi:hypothetical protein
LLILVIRSGAQDDARSSDEFAALAFLEVKFDDVLADGLYDFISKNKQVKGDASNSQVIGPTIFKALII